MLGRHAIASAALLAAATFTWNATAATPHLIRVRDARASGTSFAQDICQAIQSELLVAHDPEARVECHAGDISSAGDDYEVTRGIDGTIRLRALAESTPAGWQIESDATSVIPRLITRHLHVTRHTRLVREAALALAVAAGESTTLTLAPDGKYHDARTRAELNFESAFSRFEQEGKRSRNYLRAFLELAGIYGIGFLEYKSNHDNLADYDLPDSWENMRLKLSFDRAAWALDTNQFNTNMIMHPLAGTFYYWFSRANGLGSLEALLMAVTVSSIWETLGEFREKVSINDMVVTPIAGMAIGEVFTQLGDFFARSEGHWLHKTFALVFGTPALAHDWLRKNHFARAASYDSLGFPADRWHRFELFAGLQAPIGGTSAGGGTTGFDLEIANIPVYGQEGRGTRLLRNTAFTRLAMTLAGNTEGIRDLVFFTRAALAGYYAQDVRRADDDQLQGWSFFVGPSVGFEYSQNHRTLRGGSVFEDQIGIVHVLGSTIDLTYRASGVVVRLSLDLHGDWAAIQSFGFDRAKSSPVSSVMRDHGYGHALGASTNGRLSASWKSFEAAAEMELGRYFSIESWDRNDAKGIQSIDSRAVTRFWVGYRLGDGRVQLRLGVENRQRDGSIGREFREQHETLLLGRVVVIF